jgi:hypothetical protein
MQSVYENPEQEEDDMSGHKSETADDGRGQISQSFRRRSSRQKLLLVLGDRTDVLLDMIWDLHCLPSLRIMY